MPKPPEKPPIDPAVDARDARSDPSDLLRRAIQNERVHSGYLLTGASGLANAGALAFVRALACEASAATGVACERCGSCRRSRSADAEDDANRPAKGAASAPIALDGKGKKGPTHRHVGDHPDLFWVERGVDDTRITIGQIRDLQTALRLRGFDTGRRAAVVSGAEWMNASAQNALLRILEEPPRNTSLVIVAARPSALLATIRSRCLRVRYAPEPEIGLRDGAAAGGGAGHTAEIVALLDGLRGRPVPEILDAAERYRGGRAEAAEAVGELIDVAGAWLHERVVARVASDERPRVRELDAYKSLLQLRRDLVQRNANPQMVAERLLFGLRDVVAG